MIKLASIALTSVLGVAGLACALPAAADPCAPVGPGYGAGYYAYAHGPYGRPYAGYWHRDFERDYYHRFYPDRYHHWYRR